MPFCYEPQHEACQLTTALSQSCNGIACRDISGRDAEITGNLQHDLKSNANELKLAGAFSDCLSAGPVCRV